MTKNRFYTMDAVDGSADIYIFGIVTSDPWLDSDVSASGFVADLVALGNVSEIVCHISSYGGEVEEGLAIYNALLSNSAHVTTICEGQACSIASVIFMAGDDRIMREASALFVHDCLCSAYGDADDFRQVADDLDAQMPALKAAYMRGGISEDDLDALLKADSWIQPEDAVSYGFATAIDSDDQADRVAASARKDVFSRIFAEAPKQPEPPHEGLSVNIDAHEFAVMVANEVCGRTPEPEPPEPPKTTPAMRLAAAINR